MTKRRVYLGCLVAWLPGWLARCLLADFKRKRETRVSRQGRQAKTRQGKARQGKARQASRELSDPTKVGCYLTILVKRSRHYTIGLDPESRSVTDRERCQASHSDCLHRREQTLRFVLFLKRRSRVQLHG